MGIKEVGDVRQFLGTFGDPRSLSREHEGLYLGPNQERLGGGHGGEDVHERSGRGMNVEVTNSSANTQVLKHATSLPDVLVCVRVDEIEVKGNGP